MPAYYFKVIDAMDKTIQGTMMAPDLAVAQDRLLKMYKTIVVVRRENLAAPRPRESHLKVSTEALAVYTRQLATMIDSGVQIDRALHFLTQGEDPNVNLVSARLGDSVREGNALSAAMAEQPGCFTDVYLALVRAGEKSGTLERSLLKLADLLERSVRLRKRVTATLAYPAVIAVVCLANMAFFLLYIIPIMLPMFASMAVVLPWPTQLIIAITEFLRSPAFVMGAIVLCLAGWPLARFLRRGSNQYWLALHILRLPVVGSLIAASSSARALHTISTLLEAGVNILDALGIAAEVAGNGVMSQKLLSARAALLDGLTLHRSLEQFKVFPDMALQMIKVGEETGKVAFMTRLVGDFFEDETDHQLDRIASLIEPLMMAIMGGVVSFAVLATFLPIVSLIQQF